MCTREPAVNVRREASSGDLAVHDLRTGRDRRVTHKDAFDP